ncbi:MAG: hypothetical protein Ct9H90mP14_2630 [Methanobacteriota archaeon]|nr:MAG: hypothetical protein Ct9H90mP14_2630 [Euryarchaeota archaeon]
MGDDTLEVIAFWRPGFGSEPIYLEMTNSTMDEAENYLILGGREFVLENRLAGEEGKVLFGIQIKVNDSLLER